MLRRLFTPLSVVSLLLCIITCAMWWRSRTGSEYAYAIGGRLGLSVVVERGECTFKIVRYRMDRNPTRNIGVSMVESAIALENDYFLVKYGGDRLLSGWGESGYAGFGGFGAGTLEGHFSGFKNQGRAPPDFRFQWIAMPCWVLAAAPALLPVMWMRRHLVIRRNHGPGYCSQCGYDLRATTDRCPECGTITNAMRRADGHA